MSRTLDEMHDALTPRQRRTVAARTAELIAEEISLRELRKSMKLTQTTVASRLNKRQDEISRIEQRDDHLLSTLSGYVRSLGGELDLIARFKDRPPVRLRPRGSRDVRAPAKASTSAASGGPVGSHLHPLFTANRRAIARLCEQFGVRSLAAFGSVLRPDFDPAKSDVDLVVTFKKVRGLSPARQYFDFKAKLEALLRRPVDLVELTAMPDSRLKRIIERSKIQVYGQEAA